MNLFKWSEFVQNIVIFLENCVTLKKIELQIFDLKKPRSSPVQLNLPLVIANSTKFIHFGWSRLHTQAVCDSSLY